MTTPDAPREITVEEIDHILWRHKCTGIVTEAALELIAALARRALSQAGGEKEDHTKALIRIALASDEKNARCLQAIAMKALDWHDTASPSVSVEREREPYRKRFPDADEDAALEAERYPGAPDTPQNVPADLLEITSTEEEEEAAIQAIDAPLSQGEFQLAQLRHAYKNLIDGTVGSQEKFAKGLIGPAIEAYERLIAERDKLKRRWEIATDSLNRADTRNAKLGERVRVLTEALEKIGSGVLFEENHQCAKIARAALTRTSEGA